MVEPVTVGDLRTSLGLGSHELVALVGGGGKTTTLFALGQQLDGTVVLTTTTKMSGHQTGGIDLRIRPSDAELASALTEHRQVLAWRGRDGSKALGVSAEDCDRWFDLADHVVVEADGSRRLPTKAPGPFEPVVPSRTTTLVVCVGAGAFGRVISDCCHRPLRMAAIAGCSPYERLTPARLGRVLLSERGGRRGLPPDARFVVLLVAVQETDRTFVDELADALGPTTPLVAVAHGAK